MAAPKWLHTSLYRCSTLPLPLLLVAPLGVTLLVLMLAGVADTDLFARVAVGKLIAELHAFPYKDPFSFAPQKEAWIDHEWLSGVLFHYVAVHFGDAGLLLLAAGFAALTAVGVAASFSVTGTAAPVGIAWLTVCCFLSGFIWSNIVRSHCVTFLFFAWELYALAALLVERRLLPLLMWLFLFPIWVNCHGGFVIGILVLCVASGVALLHRSPSRLALSTCTVAAVGLTCANPYGLRFFPFIAHAILHPRPAIGEWAPFPITDPSSFGTMTFILLGVTAAIEGRKHLPRTMIPREFTTFGLTLTAMCLYMGFRSKRLMPFALFSIVVCGGPFIGAWWRALPKHHERITSLLRTALIIAIAPASVAGIAWTAFRLPHYRLDIREYPHDGLNWLRRTAPPGKVLVSFNDGSFALWRLFPLFQISVDGRFEELYPDSTIQMNSDALDVFAGTTHHRALHLLNPDYIVVSRNSSFFTYENIARFGDAWREVYRDGVCAILSRKNLLFSADQMRGFPSDLWEALPSWRQGYDERTRHSPPSFPLRREPPVAVGS